MADAFVDSDVMKDNLSIESLTGSEPMNVISEFTEVLPGLTGGSCDVPASFDRKEQSRATRRQKTVSLESGVLLDEIEKIVTKTLSNGIKELQACLREELRTPRPPEVLVPTPPLPGHPIPQRSIVGSVAEGLAEPRTSPRSLTRGSCPSMAESFAGSPARGSCASVGECVSEMYSSPNTRSRRQSKFPSVYSCENDEEDDAEHEWTRRHMRGYSYSTIYQRLDLKGNQVGSLTRGQESERGVNAFAMKNVIPSMSWNSEQTSSSSVRHCMYHSIKRFVSDARFESFICIVIVFNAVLAGVAADYEARNLGQETPYWLKFCDYAFVVIFTLELALRLYVHRASFFCSAGWGWNIFDFSAVTLQLLAMSSLTGYIAPSEDFVLARLVRLLRLIRIVRLLRVVKIIQELRLLVSSIIVSVRALVWAVALMVFLIYMFAVYITEIVSDVRSSTNLADDEQRELLTAYYGTLDGTMLIMFQSITGGVDWAMNLSPLIKSSSLAAVAFTLYVSFAFFAMLNVLTGVFIESVLNSRTKHTDTFMINNARDLFRSLAEDEQSCMTWEVFESKLGATQMIEFFKAIDVDVSEAKPLFHLLDIEGNGSISAEEFLNGALRLRGNAKALDLAMLFQEVRQIKRYL